MALAAQDQTDLDVLKNKYFVQEDNSDWPAGDNRESTLGSGLKARIASLDEGKQVDLRWLIDKVQQYGNSTP
jgi:hypothetical protein